MDMWNTLNKGLQVVQDQLDTYVDAGADRSEEGSAAEGHGAASSSSSTALAGKDHAAIQRIQELEEALQQAEDRNQLINEEFKQLLKDKEKELHDLKLSSQDADSSEALLREELGKKDKQLQELEAKSEAKFNRLKQQAKAKLSSMQEQLSVLQQTQKEGADGQLTQPQPVSDLLDSSQIGISEKEVADLRDQVEQLEQDNTQLKDQVKELTQNQEDASAFEYLQIAMSSLEEQLSEVKKHHAVEVQSLEESAEKLHASVQSLEQVVSEKSSKVEQLEEQEVAAHEEIVTLQSQLKALKSEAAEEIHAQGVVFEAAASNKAAALEAVRDEVIAKSQQLDGLNKQCNQLQESLASVTAHDQQMASDAVHAAEQLAEERSKCKKLQDDLKALQEDTSTTSRLQSVAAEEAQLLRSHLSELSERMQDRESELEEVRKELCAEKERLAGSIAKEVHDDVLSLLSTSNEKCESLTAMLESSRESLQSNEQRIDEMVQTHDRVQCALQLQFDQLQEELNIRTDQLEQDVAARDERLKSLQSELETRRSVGDIPLSLSVTSIGSDLSASGVIDGHAPSTPTRPAASGTDMWTPIPHTGNSDILLGAGEVPSVEVLQQALEAKEHALKDLNAKAELKFEKLKTQAKKKLLSLQQQHAAEKEELTKQWQLRLEQAQSERAAGDSDVDGSASQTGPGQGGGTSSTWEKSLEQRLQRLQELEQSTPVPGVSGGGGDVVDGAVQRPVRLADLKKKCEDLTQENMDLVGMVEALSAENGQLMTLLEANRRCSSTDSKTVAGTHEGGQLKSLEHPDTPSKGTPATSLVDNVSKDIDVIASEVDKQLNAVLSSVATFLFQVKDQINTEEDIGECHLPTEHEAMTRSVSQLCQMAHETHKKHAELEREHMALSMSLSTMQVSLNASQSELSDAHRAKALANPLQMDVQNIADACKQLYSENQSLTQQVEQSQFSLEQKEDTIRELGSSMSALQKSLLDATSQLATLQAQHDKALHQLHAKEDEYNNVAADHSIAETELSAAQADITKLSQTIGDLKSDAHAKEQTLADAKEQLRVMSESHETLANEKQDMLSRLAVVEQELQEKTEELTVAASGRMQLEVAVKDLQVQSEKVEQERQRQSSSERSGLVEELRLWRNKAEDAQALANTYSTQLADGQIQWSEQNAELTHLRQQVSDHERQLKAVLLEKDKLTSDYAESQTQLKTVIANFNVANASAAQQLSSSQSEQQRLQRKLDVLEERAVSEEKQRQTAQEEVSKLSQQKLQVERLYSELQTEMAGREARLGQESYDFTLLKQQLADSEAACEQLQASLDSSLANLRDREAQTLQLSSEVARLSAQQGDIEQQMRQVVRQRDLAQGQEDQLRSQVVGLQSSASLVPQLQSQIEVSSSSVRDLNHRLQESERQRQVCEQSMNAMTEQLARLETDRCRMESELQEEVRTVQLRQRDLERELEEATVTSQAQQMAQSGDDVDDVLTASTVLVSYPDDEIVENLRSKLSSESSRSSKLEQELDDTKRQVQDLHKQLELKDQQQQLQQSQQSNGMDVSINMGSFEGEDPAPWPRNTEAQDITASQDGSGAAQSTVATVSMVFSQCAQQLRRHSMGLTRHLVRAQPRVRVGVMLYLMFVHAVLLFCFLH